MHFIGFRLLHFNPLILSVIQSLLAWGVCVPGTGDSAWWRHIQSCCQGACPTPQRCPRKSLGWASGSSAPHRLSITPAPMASVRVCDLFGALLHSPCLANKAVCGPQAFAGPTDGVCRSSAELWGPAMLMRGVSRSAGSKPSVAVSRIPQEPAQIPAMHMSQMGGMDAGSRLLQRSPALNRV